MTNVEPPLPRIHVALNAVFVVAPFASAAALWM